MEIIIRKEILVGAEISVIEKNKNHLEKEIIETLEEGNLIIDNLLN